MSKGINKVILIGNVGRDPEIRNTNSGATVANLSLATSERWKDKQTSEMQERAEWHRLVAFGKVADIISAHVEKGAQIYVEGRLQTREWEDNEGQRRWTTEIVINDMQMLGRREKSPTEESMERIAKRGERQADFEDLPF